MWRLWEFYFNLLLLLLFSIVIKVLELLEKVKVKVLEKNDRSYNIIILVKVEDISKIKE